MLKKTSLAIGLLLLIAGLAYGTLNQNSGFNQNIPICDEDGNRFKTEQDARATGLEYHQFGATYCQYFEFEGSSNRGSLTREHGEDLARAYAETTEVYVQDGHNLRLKEPTDESCKNCYHFIFDHYGDPGVEYSIALKIHSDGRIEELN